MKKFLSLFVLTILSVVGVKAETVTITVGSTITDGTYFYTTFSSDQALDFTEAGVKAYVATKKNTDSWGDLESVTLTQVNTAQANTGLVIVADAAGEYDIPVLAGEVNEADYAAALSNLLSVADAPIDLYTALVKPKYDIISGVTILTKISYFGEDYIGFAFPERPTAAETEYLPAGTVYLEVTAEETEDGYWQGFASLKIFGDTQSCANIGELKAVEVSGLYEVTLTNAVVTYAGEDNFVLEEASGALNIEAEGIDWYLKAGNVLNGKLVFEANVTDYSDDGMGIVRAFELTEDSQTELAYANYGMSENLTITEGDAPEPLVINDETDMDALLTWAADPEWRYVKFTDAKVKIDGYDILMTYNDEDYGFINQLGAVTDEAIEGLNDGDAVEVTGFVINFYGSNYIEAVKITVKPSGTTGITDVTNGEATSSEIYNLGGQRVQKATKGLYIIGGKKVVIK